MTTFSKKEALTFGWNTFKKNPWIFVGIAAFLAIVSLLFQQVMPKEHSFVELVLGIVTTVIQWWLYLGLTRITLAAYAGSPISFKMLFGESWNMLWHYIVAMVVTIVLVCIGLVLLVVPGIIVQIMLSLSVFLIVEKNMKPIEALKESRRLTKGHRWNMFLLFLLLALVNGVGLLLVGVGLLVTIPVTFLALTWMYKEIEKGVQLEPVSNTPLITPTPKL
ncbi:MAG: YciC family protein [Patescibacteria group bacterium]